MENQMIILKSDMAGEDESYIIGAVLVPQDSDMEAIKNQLLDITDTVRENVFYEDEDIIRAIQEAGFTLTDSPIELTVRY